MLREESFGGLCYSKQYHIYSLVNETALAILRLCNGKRKVEEIISIIAEKYSNNPASIEGDIIGFIAQLEEGGYVELKAEET